MGSIIQVYIAHFPSTITIVSFTRVNSELYLIYRYSNIADGDLIKIAYVGVNNVDIAAVSSMVIETRLHVFPENYDMNI